MSTRVSAGRVRRRHGRIVSARRALAVLPSTAASFPNSCLNLNSPKSRAVPLPEKGDSGQACPGRPHWRMIGASGSRSKEVCGAPPLVSPDQPGSASDEARREGHHQGQEQGRQAGSSRSPCATKSPIPRRSSSRTTISYRDDDELAAEAPRRLADVATRVRPAEEVERRRELRLGLLAPARGDELFGGAEACQRRIGTGADVVVHARQPGRDRRRRVLGRQSSHRVRRRTRALAWARSEPRPSPSRTWAISASQGPAADVGLSRQRARSSSTASAASARWPASYSTRDRVAKAGNATCGSPWTRANSSRPGRVLKRFLHLTVGEPQASSEDVGVDRHQRRCRRRQSRRASARLGTASSSQSPFQ